MQTTEQDRLLTETEAAEFLRLNPGTLRRWRCIGNPDQPPYVRMSRCAIRYRQRDLEKFVEQNLVVEV
jgi:hypothetical protein